MAELFEQTLVTSIDDNDRIALGQTTAGTYKNILWSVFKTLLQSLNLTFTNPLGVATPTADGHAATKKYVDDRDIQNLKKSGSAQSTSADTTFSGYVRGATPTNPADLTRKDYVDTLDGANVKLTGDQTIAGVKTLSDELVFALGFHMNNASTIPANSADHMGDIGDFIFKDDYFYMKTKNNGWLRNFQAF